MTFRKAILSLAVLLVASAPLAVAQGTYTQIDVPGATYTGCWGINAAGDIAGSYADSAGKVHGFFLSGGTYTSIDYPGADLTVLYGLNNLGQVVGVTSSIGFVYDLQTQTFINIEYPGATLTVPTSINDAGTIAGYFSPDNKVFQGFERAGVGYHLIVPPGASFTYVFGITASGELSGNAYIQVKHSTINFLFDQGFQRVAIPHAPEAAVFGINSTGTAIVGSYNSTTGFRVGFVFQNGSLQTLSVSGADDTFATAVNDSGVAAGYWVDVNNVTHGFLWMPSADAEKK
jgi:hypothetical protein